MKSLAVDNIDYIKKVFISFFLLINSILYLLVIFRLEGSQVYFTIFAIISLLNVINSIYFKSFFFEKFFNFYIWLGYFFLYSIHIIFFNQDYNFGIGNFSASDPLHLKELFIVLIFFNLGILLSSFVSRKIFKINYQPTNLKLNNFFFNKKNYILLLFLFIILLISFINIKFKLFDYYYFYEARYNVLLDSFLKWFFLFGFSSIFCVILNLEHTKKFFISLFLISSIQEFLFYFSILSRGCIFNSSAVFFALIAKNSKNHNFSMKFLFFLIFFIFSLFILNFYILIDLRSGTNIENFIKYRGEKVNIEETLIYKNNENTNIIKKEPINQDSLKKKVKDKAQNKDLTHKKKSKDEINKLKKIEDIKNKDRNIVKEKLFQIFFSVKNRLFGIDSLMVVVAYDKKDFNLLIKSFKEKFTPGKLGFFDSIRTNNQENIDSTNVTLPGIVAFLYYSDSITFVFISIFFIILFFNIIERFNIYLNNNVFLSSLISQLLAYRLWHFGYAPSNSYKFFLAIILTIIIAFLFEKTLLKFKIIKK